MKDLSTGKMLFRGNNENRLYPLHIHGIDPGKHVAFEVLLVHECWLKFCIFILASHAGSKILFRVLDNKTVPLSGTLSFSFCQLCPLGKCTKFQFSVSVSVVGVCIKLSFGTYSFRCLVMFYLFGSRFEVLCLDF